MVLVNLVDDGILVLSWISIKTILKQVSNLFPNIHSTKAKVLHKTGLFNSFQALSDIVLIKLLFRIGTPFSAVR